MLTGGGALAAAVQQQQVGAKVYSVRHLNDKELAGYIDKAEVVIHNAANLTCATLEEALADNFILSKRVINACAAASNQPLLVLLSSMSFLETAEAYKPLDKLNNYALSKYLAEHYCLQHSYNRKLVVRFSTLFYGDSLKDGLSRLCYDAVKNKAIELINEGRARRDFIPLSLAVKALMCHISVIDKQSAPQICNIASGQSISFAEIAQELSVLIPGLQVTNRPAPPAPEILYNFTADPFLKQQTADTHFLSLYIARYIQSFSNEGTGI